MLGRFVIQLYILLLDHRSVDENGHRKKRSVPFSFCRDVVVALTLELAVGCVCLTLMTSRANLAFSTGWKKSDSN